MYEVSDKSVSRGFTLIELLVMGIIGIMATIIFANWASVLESRCTQKAAFRVKEVAVHYNDYNNILPMVASTKCTAVRIPTWRRVNGERLF
jgi:type II secretory pathway pseudopilin PulG